ncbi:MAG: peptide deformylase [Planctomycetota bacterium]
MRLVRYPEPVLMKKSEEVEEFNDKLRHFAYKMFEVMYRHKGIGLAAPQVGILKRIIVINLTGNEDDEISLVNPIITKSTGSQIAEEGCLSFPGIFAKIERGEKITGNACNLLGESVDFEAHDLLARAIAHEVDHLDGILLCDKMSPTDKIALKTELRKLEKLYAKGTCNPAS